MSSEGTTVQFVPVVLPDCCEAAEAGWLQDWPTCREYWLMVARLTFSTMSISPCAGQFAPWVKKPGQTEHCGRGKMMRRRRTRRGETYAVRDVVCVKDEQAADGQGLLAEEVYGVATEGGVVCAAGGVVDFDDGMVVAVDESEASGGSVCLGQEVDVSWTAESAGMRRESKRDGPKLLKSMALSLYLKPLKLWKEVVRRGGGRREGWCLQVCAAKVLSERVGLGSGEGGGGSEEGETEERHDDKTRKRKSAPI